MGIALPLEKMSRKEKIEAMESLWDDLCRHADKMQSPAWHGAVLEQREENLRVVKRKSSTGMRPKKISGKNASEDQDS